MEGLLLDYECIRVIFMGASCNGLMEICKLSPCMAGKEKSKHDNPKAGKKQPLCAEPWRRITQPVSKYFCWYLFFKKIEGKWLMADL